MTEEIYKRYRPASLKRVIGQENAIEIINGFITRNSFPHFMVLTGPSGCGKTTIAKILKKHLNCSDIDFEVINAAQARGIDTIRDIQVRMSTAPLVGDARVFLFDEAHRLTPEAQDAALLPTEDTPKHVYFIFCTTNPSKLIKTIWTRAVEIRLESLSAEHLEQKLTYILEKEKVDIDKDVVDRIVELAEGSARKAEQLLESIIGITGKDKQLKRLLSSDIMEDADTIIAILMGWQRGAKFNDIAKVISNIDEKHDWNQLRIRMLAVAGGRLIKAGHDAERAYRVIQAFEGYTFDSGKPGRACFLRACYELLPKKK
jgi:DNA polymerase-3 subunit gamma/tau